MDCFGIFALAFLLLGVVQGYPQLGSQEERRPWLVGQQQQNPWLRPQIPQVPDASSTITTTTASTPANQEPRYLACLQTCPITSEYNPICGSDNNNYYNLNRFNCAVGCGLDIQRVHQGICRT
ncbi:uncharacterized protein Kaz1-ORFB [Drosophila kikkawai]|uniref:Uncharacterized protein Kaz1-ORFB n=1 Tax=Drosophila kikkawai TaxID=30033 RepID=A0A6P4J2P9_DROKI|nr:uncharacterized protein LOC108079069 isoform X2 [Drosophila kikkawai]